MPRRHAVASLPSDQLDFVIQAILDGETDREIAASFKEKFKKKLSKSALNRWREAAGNELADRYRLARFQAKQLLSDIEAEDTGAYQTLIKDLEDRLLTATRESIAVDPIKMLRIRVEEEKRRVKERALDLAEKKLELDKEKMEREANLHTDRFKIAADTWQFILAWLSERNATGADLLTRNSEELLKDLEAHVENQAA